MATPQEYTYTDCEVVRIIDGDTAIIKVSRTIVIDIDFGFYVKDHLEFTKTSVQDFRLSDIDCPEVVGENKAKGLEAKAALGRMLALGPLRLVSHGKDKFGRWLATLFVTLPDGTEININQALVAEGFAEPYLP